MTLRFENVSKVYPDGRGAVAALTALDLVVNDGEFVAVMGPSGSGKSTLALIAAGVERPSSGRVWLDHDEVTGAGANARARLRRQRVGVVFQRDDLDPLLTAQENVALPLRLDGRRKREADTLARAALDRCGVLEIGDRVPGSCSGGQRQRVAIARAIVGERRLIVADEPTASVDTNTARAIAELLADLADAGLGILMSTHDSRLASFADDVVFLRDGIRVVNAKDATRGQEVHP